MSGKSQGILNQMISGNPAHLFKAISKVLLGVGYL